MHTYKNGHVVQVNEFASDTVLAQPPSEVSSITQPQPQVYPSRIQCIDILLLSFSIAYSSLLVFWSALFHSIPIYMYRLKTSRSSMSPFGENQGRISKPRLKSSSVGPFLFFLSSPSFFLYMWPYYRSLLLPTTTKRKNQIEIIVRDRTSASPFPSLSWPEESLP